MRSPSCSDWQTTPISINSIYFSTNTGLTPVPLHTGNMLRSKTESPVFRKHDITSGRRIRTKMDCILFFARAVRTKPLLLLFLREQTETSLSPLSVDDCFPLCPVYTLCRNHEYTSTQSRDCFFCSSGTAARGSMPCIAARATP